MVDIISLFWLADIMDLPFMAMFDTTYPLNAMFWFFGWLLIWANHSYANDKKEK